MRCSLPGCLKLENRPVRRKTLGALVSWLLTPRDCLSILREAVKPPIVRYMFGAPQYAYRPGASTADALLRASFHCSAVRALLGQHQRDHTSKLLGSGEVDCVGGMMISIDLRKAFDSVSHAELYTSMLAASVPADLASVLMQIHVQTQCHVLHGGSPGVQCNESWSSPRVSSCSDSFRSMVGEDVAAFPRRASARRGPGLLHHVCR